MPRSQVKGQVGMDERIVEDKDIEAALEDRQAAKERLAPATIAYQEADQRAKAAVDGLGLRIGEVVRVGRFRIEYREVKPREVTFETKPSTRYAISNDET